MDVLLYRARLSSVGVAEPSAFLLTSIATALASSELMLVHHARKTGSPDGQAGQSLTGSGDLWAWFDSWSSTSYAAIPEYAWFVNFNADDNDECLVNGSDKGFGFYVRAVRSGP